MPSPKTPAILERLAPGTTLGALHRATGISTSHLSHIFNGRRVGTLKVLRRIAVALGLSLEALLVALEGAGKKPKRKAARPEASGRALVGVIMGSDTDLPVMMETIKTLRRFEIPFEVEVTSAHRSPERTHEYARTAASRGLKVIIVGAGGASHLAGIVAAETTLPVIAVPVVTTPLAGLDALYSTVQMPAGVPVAVMAVDKPGATNAGIFAAEILATSPDGFGRNLAARLEAYKEELARSVGEKSARVKQQLENPQT